MYFYKSIYLFFNQMKEKCCNLLSISLYCIFVSVTYTSFAEIAQLVEHFTRNEGVVGSSPIFSFLFCYFYLFKVAPC